jgi:hypothetical protein
MREADLIRTVWTGHAFEPDGNFAMAACHDRLGEGQVVLLDLDPDRSKKSHNHQFAFVRTAWDNLPEALTNAPWAKTVETFRKHALIATGHCDTDMIAVGDERRAERVAAFTERMAVKMHGYAVTTIEGPCVYCHTPHSQRLKDMGGAKFKQSKQDILEWMAAQIGVETDVLAKMGKKGTA